jgi:hypothetical protein
MYTNTKVKDFCFKFFYHSNYGQNFRNFSIIFLPDVLNYLKLTFFVNEILYVEGPFRPQSRQSGAKEKGKVPEEELCSHSPSFCNRLTYSSDRSAYSAAGK